MAKVVLIVINLMTFVVMFLLVVTSLMLSTALLLVMSFANALFLLFLVFEVGVIDGEIVHVIDVLAGITINILHLPHGYTFLKGHKELLISEALVERAREVW